MNASSPAKDQDNTFEYNSFEFPPLDSVEETSEDAAAALFEQLQMIRDENRVRWGEHHHGAAIEDGNYVVDILQEFRNEPNDDKCEIEEANQGIDGKRTPLRSLTNETKPKGVKKASKSRKSKSKGKKNKKRQTKEKSNKSHTIIDTQNDATSLGTKHKFVNSSHDDDKSKQSIGISKPTYEINDFGVDHSLVLNFALPKALAAPTETVQTVDEESLTNSPSTVGLTIVNGLDVIEEAEEEVDQSPVKSECNEESRYSTEDQMGVTREECHVLEAEMMKTRLEDGSRKWPQNYCIAMNPLLSSTSFQEDDSSYYNDDISEDEQYQMCSSDFNCTFFSGLVTLFMGQKKSQNCLVLDAI